MSVSREQDSSILYKYTPPSTLRALVVMNHVTWCSSNRACAGKMLCCGN